MPRTPRGTFPAGRGWRERWNPLCSESGVTAEDQLVAKVTSALDWLDQEDAIEDRQQKHAAAVSALWDALRRSKPLAELQRL